MNNIFNVTPKNDQSFPALVTPTNQYPSFTAQPISNNNGFNNSNNQNNPIFNMSQGNNQNRNLVFNNSPHSMFTPSPNNSVTSNLSPIAVSLSAPQASSNGNLFMPIVTNNPPSLFGNNNNNSNTGKTVNKRGKNGNVRIS